MIDGKELDRLVSEVSDMLEEYEESLENDSAEHTDTPENCRKWALFHLTLARRYWKAAGELEDLLGLNSLPEKTPPSKKSTSAQSQLKRRWVSEVLFYLVLVMVVLGTFVVKMSGGGAPMSIAGYSFFTVLSGSMQNEIPQGSLIITRQEDAASLQVGDTITYMTNQTTVVTHRIVGIIENYQDTGMRAFETKGIMNDNPDKLPVPAVNVIGKVIFHNYTLGRVAAFVGEYWMYIGILLISFWGLGVALKSFFRRTGHEIK